MKKWTYLISGMIIGSLATTVGGAFAEQVKSLVGKKVTAEYDVVVNGKPLQAKGAVIDGQTNVPVRPIADAVGADIQVEDQKILVTLEKKREAYSAKKTDTEAVLKPEPSGNKFMNDTKESLEIYKEGKENTLKYAAEGHDYIAKDVERLKKAREEGLTAPTLESREAELAQLEKRIAEGNEELRLVNEALEAKNKKTK